MEQQFKPVPNHSPPQHLHRIFMSQRTELKEEQLINTTVLPSSLQSDRRNTQRQGTLLYIGECKNVGIRTWSPCVRWTDRYKKKKDKRKKQKLESKWGHGYPQEILGLNFLLEFLRELKSRLCLVEIPSNCKINK